MSTRRGPLAPDQHGTPRPWYGHPWVWLLIAIPGASVVGGIVMISLAMGSPNDLVRDDYYKAGLAINQDLSAEQRAEELGIHATLENRGPGHLLLRVQAPGGVSLVGPYADLMIELQHPTLAERDLQLRAGPVAHGRWALTLPRFEGTRSLRVRHPEAGWAIRREVRAPRVDGDSS